MQSNSRKFGLGIWGLALGYFVFYLPYCAMVKATTAGLLPGIKSPSAFEMLPATGLATAAVMLLIITAMGWWKHAGHRRILGVNFPCPTRLTLVAGIATAVIIYSTTLVYSFLGVSILLAMLLLRAGVLLLSPAIDVMFKRRVRSFSWAALGLSLLALLAALSDVATYHMTLGVALTVAAYLSGYMVRLPCINSLAKSGDSEATYRYLIEEQMVAMATLIVLPATIALTGTGGIALEFRHGFTSFFSTPTIWPALGIGALYACLSLFGTLIYLDRRENTFCIPLNRCSSLLSAVVASYALTVVYDQRPPGTGQLVGAGLIVIAVLFLSPLHHFRRQLGRLEKLLSESQLIYLGLVTGNAVLEQAGAKLVEAVPKRAAPGVRREEVEPVYLKGLRRVFLFVCNGNTSRSPMAQAICTQQIARRLRLSVEGVSSNNERVRVISAGLSARPGSPMRREAEIALERLQVEFNRHVSQSLTAEMVGEAERIFCMTRSQRQRVIDEYSAPANKVLLLDPHGDIDEPAKTDSDAFLSCASRIREMVSRQLDELGITVRTLAAGTSGD